MDEFLKTICGVFALEGVYLGNEVIKCGNINDTYRMDLRTDSGLKSYIVQRINHNVFRHPERIISNVCAVTEHIARKLEQNGMVTMGDVALCSERSEDLLYRLFGKNAELLIDHAWGWEPTTIEAIKAYRPSTNSISSGQVLHCPYEAEKARLVIREMTDLLVLDLVDKGLVTDQMVLTVGYDIENLTDPARSIAAGLKPTPMDGRCPSRRTARSTLTATPPPRAGSCAR